MLDRLERNRSSLLPQTAELDIIAQVAEARIVRDIADNPTRKSLFAIVGFEPEITSAIARQLGAIGSDISINVNPELNDGTLPEAWLSTKSATHFRNMERSSGGGAIVFAVPTDHLGVVGATLGEVKQISEETLSQPDLWFGCCPDIATNERERAYVANFVQGARLAGLFVTGLPMLARFMIMLNKTASEKDIERALDESLPTLRIPRGAGGFRSLSKKGRIKSVESWKADLLEVHLKAESALYLTNERGAPLDRTAIRERIQVLLDGDKIDQFTFDTFVALLADRKLEIGHWRPTQEDVSRHLEWDVIERILKATKQAKKAELGEATIKFFRENLPREITKEDEAILQGVTSESRHPDEVEKDFFFRKRDFLKDDRKILKRWESFIFKNAEVHADPLIGIVLSTAEMLSAVEQMPDDPRIVVVLEGAAKKAFWKAKNASLTDYLRNRYRGLRELLAQVGVSALIELTGNILRPQDAAAIAAALDAFHAAYTEAVRAFTGGLGLAEPAVVEQSRLFGELLAVLREVARKDDCRNRIWMPALSIGIAKSIDKPRVAISCPWHPFRLAEAAVKARRFAEALREMIAHAGNGTSLRSFAQLRTETMHFGWHPTMSIVADHPKPRLLIESDYLADFGLMEPPTVDQGAGDAFDGYAKEATAEFMEAAKEYLELSPHERANFSVVLYNADNRDLPSRFADQLARKIENESDLRCELILTHTDPQRLRQIYAEQNVTISRELDGVLASEAAQNFLSRLRVGFLNVETVGRAEDAGRAADIVFLHDVIARSAHTSWRKCETPDGGWPSFADHNPNSETRRQSHEHGSRKTEVLLAPVERPREVQSFINLVHDLHTDDQDIGQDHYVPIREVKFDDGAVSKAIDAAHDVAKWVVTFDAIADRQLLLNNDISVIRFITRTGSSHNVIISTKENSTTLMERLVDQIDKLIGGPKAEQQALADKLIRDAALISGRLVLRAARVENNALELLGLVLCRRIVLDSLPKGLVPVTWLLLDDFAAALGQKEGKRADLLIVSLGEDRGKKVIDLTVLESKFINVSAFGVEAKSSLEQTRASTNDLRDRLVLNLDVLNQETWRTRLANLIIEHGVFIEDPAGVPPKQWAKLIRTGAVEFRICGTSMVFAHDCKDDPPEPNPSEWADQQQYVFGRSAVVGALKRVAKGTAAAPITIAFPKPTCSSPSEQGPPADPKPVVPPSLPVKPPPVMPPPDAGHYPPPVEAYIQAYPPPEDEALVEEWLATTAKDLKKALKGYNLDAEILGQRLTPNSALIRFKGSNRLTLDDIAKRKTLLFTSHSIDVVDARPGAGEVVAVVRRPKRATLSLPDLWKKRLLGPGVPNLNGNFLLGEKEMDGSPLYLNLSNKFGGQPQHGPHTLIAGETGGGKGVLTRNIVLDILATNSPANARIRFVDPKYGADYPWLSDMPHLDGGIVTDKATAIETLKFLVEEMERRYQLITLQAKLPNIDLYNAKVPPSERLPRIYLFHDEIGDWMADRNSDYPDAVSDYVVRLASKARAAGVHLTLITQRPDRDAMPPQIKANINNKICLRVSSKVNSQIVLDESGGETLLGQGHFVAKLANEPVVNGTSLVYGQAPFMPDQDAWDLAQAIKAHWA